MFSDFKRILLWHHFIPIRFFNDYFLVNFVIYTYISTCIFHTHTYMLYFVKRDERKEGIDLNAILVNLTEEKMSPQYPTSPPKLFSDTSTSENSSDCFNKQTSLDEDVDGEILRILDDLLNLRRV